MKPSRSVKPPSGNRGDSDSNRPGAPASDMGAGYDDAISAKSGPGPRVAPSGPSPAVGGWWRWAGLAAAVAAAAGGACSIESVIGFEPVADPAAAVAARTETEATTSATAAPGESGGQEGDDEGEEISPLDIAGEIINKFDLVDGDCFNQVDSIRAGRKVTITSLLDCDQPHWAEVFHTFEVDAPHPAIYPGARAMEGLARRGCYERFESFVGQIYELSELRIGIFIPDRGNFEHPESRYRGIHCWLYHGTEETLQGSARGQGL